MKLIELCLLDEVYSILQGEQSCALLDFEDNNSLYREALLTTLELHESINKQRSLSELNNVLKRKTKACTSFTMSTGLKWPV